MSTSFQCPHCPHAFATLLIGGKVKSESSDSSSGHGNKEGREAEAEEGRKAEAEEGREAEAEEGCEEEACKYEEIRENIAYSNN
ncbi:hypothetical protein Glove_452g50 [Diversispora epigaea]|uniref:Uncharacterized protein n=1 Tax=Diversispora epigaea TaxID=1348612 RepID=A0A397GUD6_9GLOM|nr:hypothetical protein Glove_452g50 [Diversispora epigaea]